MTVAGVFLKKRRLRVGMLCVVVLTCVVMWRLSLMFGRATPDVGLVNGTLRPCPESPNCVCSLAPDALHQIKALRITGSARQEWDRLQETIRRLARTRIVIRDDCYMHVEFTTALLRFVDDVEFLLDDAAGVIQIRSASRVGHSDLGTNRRRMEQLRQVFERDLHSVPAEDDAMQSRQPVQESL